MGAQLAATVFVKDPETRQTVTLDPGTLPEPRLAALVTNPAAWVDGKLPRLPKLKAETSQSGDGGPSGDPDAASGDASATSAADNQSTEPEPDQGADDADTKPAARKTAARKTAARKPQAD